MSPYISIVQSSMYGKTRLVLEIAQYHYRTVYLCLRSKTSSEYPCRTEGAFYFLFAGPVLGPIPPSEREGGDTQRLLQCISNSTEAIDLGSFD